jgi:hypothetical protein
MYLFPLHRKTDIFSIYPYLKRRRRENPLMAGREIYSLSLNGYMQRHHLLYIQGYILL